MVVLPAPLRPTKPILSPGLTRKVVGSSSSRAPARTSSSVAWIMSEPIVPRRGLGFKAEGNGFGDGSYPQGYVHNS